MCRRLRRRRSWAAGGYACGAGLISSIATPGRLLDLVGQRLADLRSVEILVLDEADRMLDMGFIRDIRKIISGLPARRQTMLFSATMPPEIRQWPGSILRDPATVQVSAASLTADRIDQSVYFVDRTTKPPLLAQLVNELPISRAIVFTRTKHGADRLVRRLHASGIASEAIHGNKSQNAAAAGAGKISARARRVCSSPPMSPRAGSTWMGSPTW